MALHDWVVLVHLLSSFAFVLGHGASVVVLFRIRRETDPLRIGAQLDVSLSSLGLAFGGLLVLLVSGIVAGFTGGFWGRAWIWVSLGLLVVMAVHMGLRATGYTDAIRHAIGTRGMHDRKDAAIPPAASPAELAALLASPRPLEIALVGGIGLALIVYLMHAQPF